MKCIETKVIMCCGSYETFGIDGTKNKLNVKLKTKNLQMFSHVSTVLIEWHMHFVLLMQATCLWS